MINLKTKFSRENIKYGKKLKKKLIDLGISNKELAEELGIDPRYVSKIIRGERSGRKYRKRISDILRDREKDAA